MVSLCSALSISYSVLRKAELLNIYLKTCWVMSLWCLCCEKKKGKLLYIHANNVVRIHHFFYRFTFCAVLFEFSCPQLFTAHEYNSCFDLNNLYNNFFYGQRSRQFRKYKRVFRLEKERNMMRIYSAGIFSWFMIVNKRWPEKLFFLAWIVNEWEISLMQFGSFIFIYILHGLHEIR